MTATSTAEKRSNETDAGNSSYGIRRFIDGCQRPPALPFGVPFGKLCRSTPFPLAEA